MSRALKRVTDVMVAALGLLALAPVLAAVAVAVRLAMGPPMFFRQVRPGYRGRPFVPLKFRTMREPARCGGRPQSDGERLASDAARLTPLGRFLRRWSLDELPQLWNVLKGDLSLVGPRPLLTQYLPLYTPEQARRHDVRPGITGWAQVNGRNAVTWEERLRQDVWYVDHWSLGLDLRILALTVIKVVRGDGVSAQGSATMPPFRGAATTAVASDPSPEVS